MVAEEVTPARSSVKAAASEIGDTPSARLPESPIEEVRRGVEERGGELGQRGEERRGSKRCGGELGHWEILSFTWINVIISLAPVSHSLALECLSVQIAEGSINESASIEFAEDIESAQVRSARSLGPNHIKGYLLLRGGAYIQAYKNGFMIHS